VPNTVVLLHSWLSLYGGWSTAQTTISVQDVKARIGNADCYWYRVWTQITVLDYDAH